MTFTAASRYISFPDMKYLVVSDIHGCLPTLEKVLSFFNDNNYDMMLILGDVLNYGPRNGVPQGLDAMAIVDRLNAMADRIVAIRGNCDSEVDQMLLNFPMMADCSTVVNGRQRYFLTHGHIYSPQNRPSEGIDVFFSGHTHLWELRRDGSTLICNTGSITFPKEGREATFATIEEDGRVVVRTLDGTELASHCQ